MKILGIEHLGIAVDSIDKTAPFWKHVLKLSHRSTENVIDQGVKTDIYDTGKGKIELLESLGSDTTIAKFLNDSNHRQSRQDSRSSVTSRRES